VTISADATIPTADADRTVELWAYSRPGSWAVDTNTLFDYGTNVLHQAFGIDMDQYPNMQIYTWGDDMLFDTALPREGWFHVAATYDGTVVRAFVNGEQRGSLTVSAPLETTSTIVTVGGSGIITAFFDGMLDELRIWSYARTQEEIAGDMRRRLTGNENGLVVYLNMEEGTGVTTEDATGNGNHGDLVGASGAQVSPAWVGGPSWTQ
jgi:hypothetical protein